MRVEASLNRASRLTRTRAMTWIALGDWHQSGAFHVLPQTTTWEMRCDLPCPRDLWDAKDLTTQAVEAYKQKKRQAPPCLDSLKALTKVLMDDHWKPIDLLSFTSIAIEGLELALFGPAPPESARPRACPCPRG